MPDMTVRPILRMGDPVLRQTAAPVTDPADPAVQALIDSMTATLDDSAGIGLAAPQVGVLQRVILARVPEARAGDDPDDGAMPLTALVNPVLEPVGDTLVEGWEGCLSIPGLRGLVPRWQRIRVTAATPDGATVDLVVAGTRARVIQHEVDHLDGVLYIDRMTDFSRFGFNEEVLEAEAARRRLGGT